MTKRHYCPECKREWVFASNWNGKNCPACGSPEVTVIEYKPAFPGADIPRPDAPPPPTLPGAVLPISQTIQQNPTLAASGDIDPYVAQLGTLIGEAL